MYGACNSIHVFIFGPAPWSSVKKVKVNFKDFKPNSLCVFSQIKDTKYIRRDFILLPWSFPIGVGLGGA